MRKFRNVLLGTLFTFFGFGCDADICIENETQACLCSGGIQSAQSCSSENTWNVCQCDGATGYDSDVMDAPDSDPKESDIGSRPDLSTDMGGTDSENNADVVVNEPDGAQLYTQYCTVCHAADGSGTRLGDDIREDALEEDTDELIDVIIRGDDDMPPIAVTTKEAMAIVEWMRANFEDPGDDDDDDD